jgi:hypothetical protein
MLSDSSRLRYQLAGLGQQSIFKARLGGKSYNQGTPIWREQPPWEI